MTSDTSPDTQPQPPAGSSRFRDAVRLVVWCVVCLAAPLVFLRGDPPTMEPEERADDQPDEKRRIGADTINVKAAIEELRAAKPDCIGIGNSMMYTRLGKTPEAMSALAGRKFFFLYKNGSDTPVWYLTLKNIVAASGVRPRAVLFFIRDNELTAPFAAKDDLSSYSNSLEVGREPELERFMRKSRGGQDGRVDHWLEDMYSFAEWKARMSHRLTDVAMDLGGGGSPKKSQRFALSARFSLENLRGDVGADVPLPEEFNLVTGSFDEVASSSLLPEILRIVKECGTRLIVFRVKRRPDEQTHLPEEPGAMRSYSDFLNRWLRDRGASYYDETYDTSIRLTDYLDGDHIRPERLDWYRDYFWKRMKGEFP